MATKLSQWKNETASSNLSLPTVADVSSSPSTTTAAVAAAAASAATTSNFAEENSLLRRRLVDAGVSADVLSFHNRDSDQQRQQQRGEEDRTIRIVDIKTLVWEVRSTTTTTTTTANGGSEEDRPTTPFYVVAAVPLDKRVDEDRLRKLIFEQQQELPSVQRDDSSNGRAVVGSVQMSIKMATQIIAEQLTGFASGCMPPISHTSAMPLLIDSSIVQTKEEDSNVEVITNFGSGILGKSLFLPLSDFLRVAAKTSDGVHVGSIADPPSEPNPDATPRERRLLSKQEREMEVQPKPKDRLKEYRLMDNMLDKAKALRTVARRKNRHEEVKTIIDEAVAMGEYPELFTLNAAAGFSKHALHMGAWRGDFEAVRQMCEASRRYDLDVANAISVGEESYGKTPIFYALTQCREDVVRYLVDEAGASLLIVNNKGQTPCSIAVSHLSEEACRYLYDVERSELEAGGIFTDHRRIHSDNMFYGDLDPRFPIDHLNYGEDLQDSLKQFHASVEGADASTKINSVPTKFTPRSLRPTERWWNREDASLENANTVGGRLTFTQRRVTTTKKKHKITKDVDGRQQKKSTKHEESPKEIDVDLLELLSLDSVLRNDNNGKPPIIFVNCTDTLHTLQNAIDASIEYTSTKPTEDLRTDNVLINASWGLDCEWKPGIERGKDNPVATLQLSTRGQSYLVDLQSLCQSTFRRDTPNQTKLTDIEEQTNRTLAELFQHDNLPVLGFGVLQDLGKLAASFPHLSCFTSYHSVIDLHSVSSAMYSKILQPQLSSLQKMVSFLLAKRLDKKQQCSDWTQRPLSKVQIEYAVLDAAVLPLLLQKVVQNTTTLEHSNDQIFALSFNLRYTHLQDHKDHKWHVPTGSVRNTLSPNKHMVRQSWPSNQTAPGLPKLIAVDLSDKVVTNKERAHLIVTNKERAHLIKIDHGKKPKPIQLCNIAGNLVSLPIPGVELGYTKDSCAIRVIGDEFMDKLPERTRIGFNRRSGVAATNNAWLLFCNFGSSDENGTRSLSEFSGGGQFLTFNLKAALKTGNSSERELFDQIVSRSTENKGRNTILLFARGGTLKQYIYCGSCNCEKYIISTESNSVDLLLELRDYEKLVNDIEFSFRFVELVKWREAVSEQRYIMAPS